MSKTKEEATEETLVLSPILKLTGRYVEEAPLFFGKNKSDIDPKRGLAIHGPADASDAGPETIRIGIISSSQGIQDVTDWIHYWNEQPVECSGEQPFLAQRFPGFIHAFRCKLLVSGTYNEAVTTREISDVMNVTNPNLRIKRTADLYASKVHVVSRRMSRPDVIICHEPAEVELRAGARMTSYERKSGSLPKEDREKAERIRKNVEVHELFSPLDDETRDLLEMTVNQDFRALLKAQCLDDDPPIQILTQSILSTMLPRATSPPKEGVATGRRITQDPSIIAWNRGVAIYFKAHHYPWRVGYLRSGTCYVGISFYYDKTTSEKDMQASLAQIFSDTGEGLIVRSDSFKWDVKEEGTPHLNKDTAFKLLSGAIEVYAQHHNGQLPNRVVVHKTSRYDGMEMEGFLQAASKVPKYDFLTLRADRGDIFLYRNGDNPVLRGTTSALGNSHLIYTMGYVPYLNSFPHPRIPRPIEITDHHGDTSLDELARETIALTRLNWNSTDYCAFWPVTLEFAFKVGEILGRVKAGTKIQQEYYYYM